MKKELKLLEQLNALMKRFNFIMKQLTLALTLLIRIKKRYPYIFGECITDEEVDKLCKKKDKK